MAEMSKSAMFREAFNMGMEVHEVAKRFNSNYAFVYGVYAKWKAEHPESEDLTKRKGENTNSLSAQIRSRYNAGQTVAQIRTEMKLDYSFVHGVIKRLKQSQASK